MGDWFNNHAGDLLTGVVNVVIVIVVAVVLRAIAGRVIGRVTQRIVNSHNRISQSSAKLTGRVLHQTSARADRQQQRAETIASLLKSVTTVIIFGIGFVTVLSQVGINVGPILASAGVLGLAIGFGAQSLVQDFLAGIFMISEDQYGVGDVVDVGDAVGTVEAVSLRITKIRDLNGGLWHVRNGEVQRVCNMNQDWANAVVELPLDSSADIDQAISIVQGGIDAFGADPAVQEKILERPEVNGVTEIGRGVTILRVLVKTSPGEQWALGRGLRRQLKRSLDLYNIPVAYPAYLPQTDGADITD